MAGHIAERGAALLDGPADGVVSARDPALLCQQHFHRDQATEQKKLTFALKSTSARRSFFAQTMDDISHSSRMSLPNRIPRA